MRAALILVILGGCTRADTATRAEVEPVKPAVAPKKAEPTPVEELEIAKHLEDVDPSIPITCWLRVKSRRAGLGSELGIPLGEVTWKLEQNPERVMGVATCTRPHCIHQKSESRTLDVPHHYSTHHDEVSTGMVVISRTAPDPAVVVAELNRARERCAKKP
jgi:hypothetical protein